MSNDKLIALAKEAIFGPEPTEPKALIGYNMSKLYFEPYIFEAEMVLSNLIPPKHNLEATLTSAFKYRNYEMFSLMPKETQHVIGQCSERFYRRYCCLIENKKPIAA